MKKREDKLMKNKLKSDGNFKTIDCKKKYSGIERREEEEG